MDRTICSGRGSTRSSMSDTRFVTRHRPRQGRAPHEPQLPQGPHGDAANAILAAAGYNFRRLLAWLAMIWRVLTTAILAETPQFAIINPSNPACRPNRPSAFFTDN